MKMNRLLFCGALLGLGACQSASGGELAEASLGPADELGGAPTYVLRDTINAPGKAEYPGSTASMNGAATVLTIGDHGADRVLTYTRRNNIWSAPELLEPEYVTGQSASSLSLSWQTQSGDGNTLLVSNSGANIVANGNSYGAVTVYQKTASGWTVRETLTAPANARGFGAGVALNNTGTVIAASHGQPEGNYPEPRIFVYRRGEGSALSLSATIEKPAEASREFAQTLAMTGDGNWLAAGDKSAARIPNFGGGAVFIYRFQAGRWTLATTVRPQSNLNARYFANRIAFSVDGSTLAVGDDGMGPEGAGGVVVYTRPGTTWSAQPTAFTVVYSPVGTRARTQRTGYPINLNVSFGTGVALSTNGRTLLVADESAHKAYVYTR